MQSTRVTKTIRDVLHVRIEKEEGIFVLPAFQKKLDTCTVLSDCSDTRIKKGDRLLYDSNYAHDIKGEEAFIHSNVVHAKIEGTNLIPIADVLYIDTDKTKNEGFTYGTLKLDYPSYLKEFQTDQVTQDGVIEFIGDHPTLKKGDKVYTHHFLCDPSNEKRLETGGKTYFSLSYKDVYCVIEDGKIRMMDGWNFISPIIEPEENFKTKSGIYTKPEAENIKLYGKVEHISKDLQERGVEVGDTIIFLPQREYEMNVEGGRYYRIRTKDIIAKYNAEE